MSKSYKVDPAERRMAYYRNAITAKVQFERATRLKRERDQALARIHLLLNYIKSDEDRLAHDGSLNFAAVTQLATEIANHRAEIVHLKKKYAIA